MAFTRCETRSRKRFAATPASNAVTLLELELPTVIVDLLRPVVAQLVREELDRTSGPDSWLTVEEYAERRRTTVAAVHQRLRRGQVEGAVKDGRRWLIPDSSGPAGTLERHDREAAGTARAGSR